MNITVQDVKARLDAAEPLTLIDCRESHEWEFCRIDGAVHIPMGLTHEHLEKIPADQPVIVYCHHGGRSARVVHFLRQHGREALNMAGGIDAWSLKIDPTVRRY